MAKATRKVVKSKTVKPSSIIGKYRLYPFSYVEGGKNISMQVDDKKYRYFPNTKVNRDELTRLKGKPDKYGKRYIWW